MPLVKPLRLRSSRGTRADRKPIALEGSRFAAWQLYDLAAGGSRERLEVWQFYGPLYPLHAISAMGKTLRWVIPGSRLLLTDRAAMLQSGSPPGGTGPGRKPNANRLLCPYC